MPLSVCIADLQPENGPPHFEGPCAGSSLISLFRQGYRPWVSAPGPLLLTFAVSLIAAMTLPREMDCRLAILREQIETWEEGVDINLSRLNLLVSDCCVKPAVGLAEDADIPLTLTLCRRERGNREGSPFGLPSGGQVSAATLIQAIRLCDEPTRPASADDASFLRDGATAGVRRLLMGTGEGNGARHIPAISWGSRGNTMTKGWRLWVGRKWAALTRCTTPPSSTSSSPQSN